MTSTAKGYSHGATKNLQYFSNFSNETVLPIIYVSENVSAIPPTALSQKMKFESEMRFAAHISFFPLNRKN